MNELFPVEVIGAEAMRQLGTQIGEALKSGDVVALVGDLGAGKTHITQGIALSRGYKGEVTSPTFALVNEYITDDEQVDIFHFDAYRLEHMEEMLQIGWEDYLERDGLVIIEWADKFPELIPDGAWCVTIETIHRKTANLGDSQSIKEGRKLICERLENR